MLIEIDDKFIQVLLDKAKKDGEIVHNPEKRDWKFFKDMLTQWINVIVEDSLNS